MESVETLLEYTWCISEGIFFIVVCCLRGGARQWNQKRVLSYRIVLLIRSIIVWHLGWIQHEQVLLWLQQWHERRCRGGQWHIYHQINCGGDILMSTMEVFEFFTSEMPVGHQARSAGGCEKRWNARDAGVAKLHELQARTRRMTSKPVGAGTVRAAIARAQMLFEEYAFMRYDQVALTL